jgi:hypothetical protein
MSSFTDTSNWKRKDDTTLVYSYELKGEKHEGLSEMEPQALAMQLKRLSILNETSWQVKDHKVIPPSLTGCIRRIHAAIFSFWAGVMPPMPMFGRSLL